MELFDAITKTGELAFWVIIGLSALFLIYQSIRLCFWTEEENLVKEIDLLRVFFFLLPGGYLLWFGFLFVVNLKELGRWPTIIGALISIVLGTITMGFGSEIHKRLYRKGGK